MELSPEDDGQDCHGDNHHTHHSSNSHRDEVVALLPCRRKERGGEKEGEWIKGEGEMTSGGREEKGF